MGVTKVKLNKDEINKIVCSAFPGQTLAAYIELTEGLCNTAYRLELDNGQKIVLKVTSGRSDGFMTNEVGMMDAEVKAMKIVSEMTDIRVANVFCYDRTREIIDGYYFLMENLDGDSWYSQWDMWEGNIFIKDNKISGIIDWERAMWTDPMMDDRFRFHARNDAFLEGFGITELSLNEKRRILWYDVFLYLTMMTEPTYRQYEDNTQYNWVKPMFMEVWKKLRESYVSVGIATNIS